MFRPPTVTARDSFFSRCPLPVSYTHLDVYKRQGVHRINEFLQLPERAIPPETETSKPDPFACPVELQNVTFRYEEGDPDILQCLSFSVKEGEQVTLTGRTGAGKSPIFKLLLGLYTPQKGKVLINGQPADTLSENQRRKIISCVEQNFSMVPGTILEQITLFDPDITLEQARTAACLTGLDDVCLLYTSSGLLSLANLS